MNALIGAVGRHAQFAKFASHLFQRRVQGRLTLVTGAGISADARVPSWLDLLTRLSEHDADLAADVSAYRGRQVQPEYLGQIIFHRRRGECPNLDDPESWYLDVNQSWAEAIHSALYRDAPSNEAEILRSHPYLEPLCNLAAQVPLVINFNFDDILDEALSSFLDARGRRERKVVPVWRPPLVDKVDTTTIYHVNGLLPRGSLRKRSDQLIFTEDSFASAISRSPDLGSEYLFLRFVQNTILILGHSLADNSLKDYLRRNRDRSPANHHYMIYWMKSPDDLSTAQMGDIFDANLELYNLITLFMTSEEIGAFCSLISASEKDFVDSVTGWGDNFRTSYHYYIAGPVAGGKSTVLEALRCFDTHEEWTRMPPKEMYLAFDKLSKDELDRVDAFIFSELREKNLRMHNAGVGIHFMDRAPLDLYAFSATRDENVEKTKKLRSLVTREKALQEGEVVFLTADGATLVKRNHKRGRAPKDAGEAAYLEKQRNDLRAVYKSAVEVDTSRMTGDAVAKRVSRHALLEEYAPIDLTARMADYG